MLCTKTVHARQLYARVYRNPGAIRGICLFCSFSRSRISLCLQLKELNHDNIEPFIGASVEPGHICYLMQCCMRGTLKVNCQIALYTPIPPVLLILL